MRPLPLMLNSAALLMLAYTPGCSGPNGQVSTNVKEDDISSDQTTIAAVQTIDTITAIPQTASQPMTSTLVGIFDSISTETLQGLLNFDEKPVDLLELTLRAYESDEPSLIESRKSFQEFLVGKAESFEKQGWQGYLPAFGIYERLINSGGINELDSENLRENLRRIAKLNYIETPNVWMEDREILTRAGLELSSDLFLARGLSLIKKSNHTNALRYFIKADSEEHIRSTIDTIEKFEIPSVIYVGFATLNDEKEMERVLQQFKPSDYVLAVEWFDIVEREDLAISYAEKMFYTLLDVSIGTQLLQELDRPITEELWSARGFYQLNERRDFDEALVAYQNAKDVEGVALVLQGQTERD